MKTPVTVTTRTTRPVRCRGTGRPPRWGLFGAVLVGWLLAAPQAAQPTAPTPRNQSLVLSVQGRVEVSPAGAADWRSAQVKQGLDVGARLRTAENSRATVQLSDLSVLRVNELTTLELLEPRQLQRGASLDLKSGSVYFFSREKPGNIQFRTPLAAGAIRGTEFHLLTAGAELTELTLLEGEVELSNALGQVVLHTGEQASVAKNQAPAKTAVLDALNIIQWCLYYPVVLDPDELPFTAADKEALASSLTAYRSGDLLAALAQAPVERPASSEAARVYPAALYLAVGNVDRARTCLEGLAGTAPLADALREMIAAVQFREWKRSAPPALATEWLAESYYLQSHLQLDAALAAARAAAQRAPRFGFAWVRIAELELGFGRSAAALAALERGLALSPRNPQALALKGFLLSGRNRVAEAVACFEQAIALDGALGNAWLGRGLCRLRQGARDSGRADLQVAAALEPQRSALRSYLGKAFSHVGEEALAEKELGLARKLDPADPTPWLYGALLNQQRNRINDAIRDLERSAELNNNRALFRSTLLLDQDRAVRGANLASAYRDAGLFEVGLREARRAVSLDYANPSAHLFLADSYETLGDPRRFNLRYENARLSELLVAQLLAPAGVGSLSRNPLQRDEARFFERDRFGLSSYTEYWSRGNWFEAGSQYGNFGNASYALDATYRAEPGYRPNNDLEQLTLAAQAKQQLGPQDSVYVAGVYFNGSWGDVAQHYSPAAANTLVRMTEKQEPNLLIGYHHEWNPGSHTLLLVAHLDDTLTQVVAQWPGITIPKVSFGWPDATVPTFLGAEPFTLDYRKDYEAYSAELQQVWQTPSQTLVAGLLYQAGRAETVATLTHVVQGPGRLPLTQQVAPSVERLSLYGYEQWRLAEPLRLLAGLSIDTLTYPWGVDTAPVSGVEASRDQVSPKLGLLYAPWTNTLVRALYSQALGGAQHEDSFRLEPSQLAGFNQAYRSLAPESAAGVTPGASFETRSVGLDQRFASGTYLGVEAIWLLGDAQRAASAVTHQYGKPFTPPTFGYWTTQDLAYEEKSLLLTADQLLGRDWSVGLSYRLSAAHLDTSLPLPRGIVNTSPWKVREADEATLHMVEAFVVWNLPGGFFSQFRSHWLSQSNRGYAPDLPGDTLWQHHLYLGYRFAHRAAEVRLGLLNLTGRDYRLNPLNYYVELPRERTVAVSLKLNF